MSHDPKLLKKFEELLLPEFPENTYLVMQEKVLPGTTQQPDLQYRARGNLSQIMCVVEIGYATRKRLNNYIDLGIPDVRWYTHGGTLKYHHHDENKIAHMRTEAIASLMQQKKTRTKKYVWTQTARRELYTAFLFKYGSQDTWPPDSKRPPVPSKEFWTFCQAQADFLTPRLNKKITKEAVEQQFAWALTNQTHVRPTHVYSWLMCKAAAREVGLIGKSGFPHRIRTI